MNARGFSLVELMLIVAVAGVLAALVAPSLASYARTSALQAGARELATAISLGRQIAITQNIAVCVELASATNIRLRKGGCGGASGPGPGRTDRRDQDLGLGRVPGQHGGERGLHQPGRRESGR